MPADLITLGRLVNYFEEGFREAWHLIWSRDPYLFGLIEVTLKVAAYPTLAALVIGLPVGVTLGLGRFRGVGALRVIANAGLGLPPVVVGLFFTLLLLPVGPLGDTELLYTLNGVYIAQTVLCLPIVVSLTSSAVRAVPAGLFDQARAFGAGRVRLALLAVREARVGIYAALIASLASGFTEIGVVLLVGGSIQGMSQTLASATILVIDSGDFARGFAIGVILIGLIGFTTSALTVLQYRGDQRRA